MEETIAPPQTAIRKLRKAIVGDVPQIQKLVNFYAKKDLMLARSLNDLYEHIRDYVVAEDESGNIIGCCALHVDWEDLAELKALAVDEAHLKQGIGRQLVRFCAKESAGLGIRKIFALTYQLEFFGRLGFKEVEKSELPHKIWMECINCSKFPACDEKAVIYYIPETE